MEWNFKQASWKRKLVLYCRNSIFVSRFASSVPSHVPFKPYVPTLIVSSLHDNFTRYRLSPVTNEWGKKSDRRRQIAATSTWQLLQEVVVAHSCNRNVRLIPGCTLCVTLMVLRKHRCKNYLSRMINNICVKKTGLCRCFSRAVFNTVNRKSKYKKNKERENYEILDSFFHICERSEVLIRII